jgi:mRNA-degrading endonuclease RelE of RelBE toxin-antitoxin system
MNDASVQVELTKRFTCRLKALRKKYPHAGDDVQTLIHVLEQGETPGDQIQGTGYTAYKTRLPNRDAQRGKSGGYRVIYYLRVRNRVILLTIYAKTELVDITPDEIRRMIDAYEHPPE